MSFLRRQVMDYKERRPGRGAFRDGGAGGDGSGKDIPEFHGRRPCGTDVPDGGGGCGASGEKRREDVCDHRFLLPVPALCRSVRAFICGGQGHKKGTDRVLLPFRRLWKGFREAVCRGGFYVLLSGIRRMLPWFPPDRVFSACRGEAVKRPGGQNGVPVDIREKAC